MEISFKKSCVFFLFNFQFVEWKEYVIEYSRDKSQIKHSEIANCSFVWFETKLFFAREIIFRV